MTRALTETKQVLGRFDELGEGKAPSERLRMHLKQPHFIYTHV